MCNIFPHLQYLPVQLGWHIVLHSRDTPPALDRQTPAAQCPAPEPANNIITIMLIWYIHIKHLQRAYQCSISEVLHGSLLVKGAGRWFIRFPLLCFSLSFTVSLWLWLITNIPRTIYKSPLIWNQIHVPFFLFFCISRHLSLISVKDLSLLTSSLIHKFYMYMYVWWDALHGHHYKLKPKSFSLHGWLTCREPSVTTLTEFP